MRAKYVLSEVFLGLWRNVTMTVAMIITMAVSLTMVGASLLLYWQVQDMRQTFADRVVVSVFLKDNPDGTAAYTETQKQQLADRLAHDPLVHSRRFKSKEEAYQQFRQMFQSDPNMLELTRPGSIPASFEVKLKNPRQPDQFINRYRHQPGVDDIRSQQSVLNRIFGILGALQNVSVIVALVQGLAALLLVANTIQVAAYSRRREVSIMKMVGASNWFIQTPFVLEAVFAGVLGSVAAFLVLVLAKVFVFDGPLRPIFSTGLMNPVSWQRLLLVLPILLGVAAVISAGTGWLTLRLRLRT